MTLAQYLHILRQQWFTVVALTLLAMAGSAAYTFVQTPIYSSSTQLFVSVSGPERDVAELQSGSTFTQQRVKSYADIVTSPAVSQAVIEQLDLPYTPGRLANSITAETPLDTVLLDITVQDTSARRAADIANAVAAEFPKLVAELETPLGETSSPVKVSVTERASVADTPVSPRVPLNLALGLLVGLGLGVGAAVLRDQLNTSVSSVAHIEQLTGNVPLGVVPFDSTAARQPLVSSDTFGGRSEAFRTLRTNLQFADVDNPPRVIVVTSPLPGEGKSTTSCNLALTLALNGARVVLVEGDLRKPAVGRYLGIDSAVGLTSVLAGQHHLRDVLVEYQQDALSVLPSGPTPPNPSELLGSQHMIDLLSTLSGMFDVVVIDAAPLLPVTDAAVLSSVADGAVLVVRHGKSRREEVARALQSLTSVNAKLLGTVLNFAPKKRNGGGYGYGYGYGYGAPAPSGRGRVTAGTSSAATGGKGGARGASKGGPKTSKSGRSSKASRQRAAASAHHPVPTQAGPPGGAVDLSWLDELAYGDEQHDSTRK